jgi:hypothetical protein
MRAPSAALSAGAAAVRASAGAGGQAATRGTYGHLLPDATERGRLALEVFDARTEEEACTTQL